MDGLFCILLLPCFIACLIACFLCADGAKKRGRSYGGWLWLAFLCSPFLIAILLIAMGETEEKRKERIIEEEEVKEQVRRKFTHPESTTERNFNPSAKTIGDMYKR